MLIAERAAVLSDLIATDPARAVSLALPAHVLSELAESQPESASLLESHGTWRGPVEYIIVDSADRKTQRSVHRISVGGETLELHFAYQEPAQLQSGDLLTVTGVQAGGQLAVAQASVEEGATAQECSTIGRQNSVVLLVTLPGIQPPTDFTSPVAYDIFFGTEGFSLDGFWREASYGKASAAGEIYGWYQLDESYNCSEMDHLRDAAINKAASIYGLDFQNYTRVFLVLPPLGCTWAGMASVGCSTLSSPTGSFAASTTYLNTQYMGPRSTAVQLVTHEAGHNLGLQHAGIRLFDGEALGPIGFMGAIWPQGDSFSTMGGWDLGHYAAPHKANLLGWLEAGMDYQVIQNSQTHSVEPFELNPAGLKALKIQRGTDNDAWLWIEYRQPVGGYDWTLPNQPFSGALIHYEDSFIAGTTHLLDFTPETSSWNDPALLVDKDWSDPYTDLSVSIESATSAALTVNVQYGAAVSCTPAQPHVSIAPSFLTISPGETASYNVSVTNNDSILCLAGSFDLSVPQPQGFVSSISPPTLTLDPGATGTATLTTSAPTGTSAGDYVVEARASHNALTGVGTANLTLVDCTPAGPTVTVTPPNPSIQPGEMISYSVAIENNDSPACPERTFDLASTKPVGWLSNFSAETIALTPGEVASVTMTKAAPSNAAAGTYPVDAKATSGTVVGEGAAACTVTETADLSIHLSLPSSSYQTREIAPSTAIVQNAGAPASNVGVDFTLLKPDGTSSSASITTDASGNAVWNYQLHPSDKPGDYMVTAAATVGSSTATSNPVMFTVTKSSSADTGGGGNGGGKSGGNGGGKGGPKK